MRPTGRNLIAAALALAVCGLAAWTPASALRRGVAPSAARQDWGEGGQTTTQLPDGRWLIAGGQTTRGVSAVVRLVDARGEARELALPQARAWHTATVLPDGRVLITGGTGVGGQTLAVSELFDPSTATFTPLTVAGAAARTGHTATLLTDGRLLMVGGDGADGRPARDEIWTVEAGGAVATPLAGGPARTRHTATLLPDGRVLIAGGRDSSDRARTDAEIFDPDTGQFGGSEPVNPDQRPTRLSGSRPADEASDVGVEARVALRFSSPLAYASVTTSNVTLVSEDGPVTVSVVPSEGGRLVFLWPARPLTPNTRYVAAVVNGRDDRGGVVARASIAFTTGAEEQGATDPPEDESWVPDRQGQGREWRTGRADSSWQALPPLMAPPGTTALAGQVLRLDGRPLAGVTLEMAGHDIETDRTGRFLLLLPGVPSSHQKLEIKGGTANRGRRHYGYFEYGLEIAAGGTTVLPFTSWMPLLDTAHQVTIASPTVSETVITTPYIPGLELHLPAGTTIRDESGQPVRTVSITPIPVDRPPFPLARNVDVPVYFTIQPGGAYVDTPGPDPKGAWLVYPNYRQARVGQRIQFFHYDPDVRGWYVYGLGTVTPSGAQVMPDATTRIYEFTGAMINGANAPPDKGKTPGVQPKADPVDPSTGVFVMQKMDLFLPDVIPVALTRTYDSGDTLARPFGRGMTHPYAMFLWSAQQYQQVDLILPDGGRIHYVRTSAGTGFTDAVFVHQETQTTSATPTAFYKSVIQWNGQGWDARLKDGTVYVFGDSAPLQAIRDRSGNTLTIAHANGQTGNVTRVTSPFGRWIAFTYDASNRITQATDNIGRIVTYTYDAGGNLATVTDPENAVTTYTWDGSNRLATITDGRHITYLTNTYTSGRVSAQTLADPAATFAFGYTVDGSGNITQTDVTDPRGHVERLTFNADHYLVTDVEALGEAEARTTTIARQTGSNLVTAVTDGLGRRAEYTYDSSGFVLTATRLAGTADAVTTTSTYEPLFHQLATVTDPLSHTWTLGHNAAGVLTGATDPLSHQTTVALNAAGLVTSVTDPLTHAWQFAYAGGDLTTTTDPLSAVRRRFIDAAGRELSVTDPLGRVSRSAVNKLNQVTSVTDAAGGQTSFSYDANGNVLSLTDALTHATSYAYDTSDRVATRTDPLSHAASYQYDLNGNLTQLTDRKSQVTGSQYDALERLVQVTFADTSTIAYTYDAGDRITQVVDSTNGTTTRTYDSLDRLTEETTPQGTVDYTYDADSRRATMTVAGQTAVSYAYNDAHRLTSITQGASAVAFTYDDANRRTTLTQPTGLVTTYGYDAANQLTSLTFAQGSTTLGTLSYTYDVAGHRTSVGGTWARTGLPPALASATYDAANRITAWAGQAMSYDANGNLASDGLISYAWNARNELAGLSGATAASFAYDAMGRRRAKTTSGATSYLYDGSNAAQELAGGSPTANVLTGGIDEVFQRTDGAGTRAVLMDALGSTVALVDASGAVQTQYTYEPFGATSTSGAASANPSQYTGRENDGTGLYYYRARYYDPRLQRFTSEDSFGFAGGDVNLHAYVGNNPTGTRDPSGHFALLIIPAAGCVGGAAGAAIGNAMAGRKTTWRDLAGGCAAGTIIGLFGWAVGPVIAPGAFAGAAAAAAAKVAASGLTYPEINGLKELFGRSIGGANQLLERLSSGEIVQLPEGVTPETLQKYRDIAERAIQDGIDNAGVQAARRDAIDILLRQSGGK